MNMKMHIFRFAVVLVGLNLWGAVLLQAQQPVFTETFDDPALPGWDHLPNAVVVDGVLRIEAGNYAVRAGDWGDLTFTVRVRRYDEGALVVNYRASDAGVYHVHVIGDVLALQREADDVVVELTASGPLSIPDGWFQLGISVTGGEHAVTLDDELVMTGTDPDPLPPGGIGFEVLDAVAAEFDDVVLTLGNGPPPAPSIGVPAYQALPWIRTGGPIGGLGYDIRYNFADPNTWYVTDAWSGLHISTDNGLTWFPSNAGITARGGPAGDAIPVFSATVDPHDPNIVWIGTQSTCGIFKSTDRGYNWVKMDNGVNKDLLPLSFRGFTVDLRTSDIVYAMGEIGSPGWTSDGAERWGRLFDMTQGIVYKTSDAGQHWREIWRGNNLARYCWIDPRDPDVLYVSTGIFDREAANTDVEAGFAGGVGILKSTDGGQTWRVLNQENGLMDLYVGSLYMHPENPDILLAAAGQDAWPGNDGELTGGVYLTEDGGEHWMRLLAGEVSSEMFSSVEFSDCDPNIAYAGSTAAVYRSEDMCHSWQRFNRENDTWGPPGVIAGFPIDMQCDPHDPMRIFVNNYLGGNFLSADGGQTWALASKGYTGAMVHHLAVAQGSDWTVYAGCRTGAFRSVDNGGEWVGLTYPPEGLPSKMNEITTIAVDPTDAAHVLTAPVDSATVLYSQDSGQTWNHTLLTGSPGPTGCIVFAPSNPDIAYAAVSSTECQPHLGSYNPSDFDQPGSGLYVSHDGGISWGPPDGEQTLGTSIITLAVHPDDPNTIYAGMPRDGVSKTTDGGKTWTASGAGLPSLYVLTLAIDPSNPDIIFAGLSGGGVYRSTDSGRTWMQSSIGMDAEGKVSSIVIDPTNGQIVYLADLLSGVFVSTDGGEIWRALKDGLDDRRMIWALTLSNDGTVLYAGIEGGGVYRLGTPIE